MELYLGILFYALKYFQAVILINKNTVADSFKAHISMQRRMYYVQKVLFFFNLWVQLTLVI